MVKKGYKFTPEQLAKRKRKAKGKWSKKARLMHSVRMKERWKAKMGSVGQVNGVEGSIKELLENIKRDSLAIAEAVDTLISKLG